MKMFRYQLVKEPEIKKKRKRSTVLYLDLESLLGAFRNKCSFLKIASTPQLLQ
jgi:hypothetical protein